MTAALVPFVLRSRVLCSALAQILAILNVAIVLDPIMLDAFIVILADV